MSESANTWLGVIAAATLLMAVVQLGVLVVAAMLARRVARLTTALERQLKPVLGHLDSIGRDAARAASLAAAQVERADHLFANVTGRVEQGLDTVQSSLYGPVREGAAVMSAFRAAFSALKNPPASKRSRSRSDDEDALFI